jgi:hypothetical protein
MGDTHWKFSTATGSIVNPGSNWSLHVLDLAGSVVGVYNLADDLWALGNDVPLTSQMQFSIYSADSTLSGDHAIISESGDYSGSISVSIP